jgi:hypothetical protein
MDKKDKELTVLNPITSCGDGSCGCGCGVLMETKEDLPQEECEEVSSSSHEKSPKLSANPE